VVPGGFVPVGAVVEERLRGGAADLAQVRLDADPRAVRIGRRGHGDRQQDGIAGNQGATAGAADRGQRHDIVIGATRERRRRRGVVARAVEGVRTAEGPVRQHEGRPVRAGPAKAIGPTVRILPGLPGAVDVRLAEYVDDAAVHEQLDGIVAVDVRGGAGVVRREAEEVRESRRLSGDIDEVAGARRDGREAEFHTVAAAAVRRAEPVGAQVGNVLEHLDLDGLGRAAAQGAVD